MTKEQKKALGGYKPTDPKALLHALMTTKKPVLIIDGGMYLIDEPKSKQKEE